MRKNSRLPNLQNMGVYLRILLSVNLLMAMAALVLSRQPNEFLSLVTSLATIVEPVLLLSLLCLYPLYPILNKRPYWQGLAAISLIIAIITAALGFIINQYIVFDTPMNMSRAILLALITTGIVLYYLHLLQRAYSPAIAEARLQALQARIRPHFLFNSINAVLSLIRSQPKRAESALEDLSDLFRVLMGDNRELVPLSQEIALCKQYLNIEKLRLDERLELDWRIDETTMNALIPPLLLQPLLENAVYHGIEPLEAGGKITIEISSKHQDLMIDISNPYSPEKDHHSGNKMALKNIKERLQLHFDLEASLITRQAGNRYHVFIRLPLRANT
ncbi:MAG TPA: histidine kinase [Methylophilus sp.]|nr:histidine kinase [Methylophilus sp.]HQQ32299.1 histidine kinase [Methylophilus sp.]